MSVVLISNEGYAPVFGALPLKRVLQRRVRDPLALKILQGEVARGDHIWWML